MKREADRVEKRPCSPLHVHKSAGLSNVVHHHMRITAPAYSNRWMAFSIYHSCEHITIYHYKETPWRLTYRTFQPSMLHGQPQVNLKV